MYKVVQFKFHPSLAGESCASSCSLGLNFAAANRALLFLLPPQLVYERIPQGDLEQRVIHLRVLGDGAFWENTLLGETFIPLRKLVPGQHWVDWHQLGAAGSDSAH